MTQVVMDSLVVMEDPDCPVIRDSQDSTVIEAQMTLELKVWSCYRVHG